MAASIRAFRTQLYEEHLQEASFLFEQRLALRRNTDIDWPRVGEFEERLEAHIDALVVGEDLALQVCRKRFEEGDFGELFAAVCVFCRQGRANLLSEALRTVDYKDPEKLTAVADALKYELPAEWSTLIERVLTRGDVRLTPILATVSGYLRLATGPALQQAFAANPAFAAPIVVALGRLKSTEAKATLETCLRNADTSTSFAALVALLRIGAQESVQPLYLVAQRERWPRIGIGLGGDRSACNVLLEIVQSGNADSDCLLALGLLGDPAAFQSLYDSLKKPDLVDSAALALNWITGAPLFEDVFVPEDVNEDELFDWELEAWRERKEAPKRADGKPFGQMIKKLSPNKESWKRWFADNAANFDLNFRYRDGKRYAPDSLLENLVSERSHHQLRKFAAEELVIRYGCDVPFEVDMPVKQQLKALDEIARWIETNGRRFEPGRWYFAGRLMD